jgi:hypothetical protein
MLGAEVDRPSAGLQPMLTPPHLTVLYLAF